MQSAFLTLQFKASQGRHSAYPDAEFQIFLLDGANAGRLKHEGIVTLTAAPVERVSAVRERPFRFQFAYQ